MLYLWEGHFYTGVNGDGDTIVINLLSKTLEEARKEATELAKRIVDCSFYDVMETDEHDVPSSITLKHPEWYQG